MTNILQLGYIFLSGASIAAFLTWLLWVRRIRGECDRWALLAGQYRRALERSYVMMEEFESNSSFIENEDNLED